MPEPLTFKIITDADDSGIRKYDNSMGNLHVSSSKAGAALKSFSRELLQAKSGADVASAGAESLAHVFHQGLAGALVIGGFKVVSDQIKAMGELVRGVGEETATATRQLERMGEPGSLADAVKAADLLSNNLENVTKKLEAIKSGNFFSRFLADVTGASKELEKQAETLQRMKDSELALGFLKEQQKAQKSVGATDQQKQIEAINEKYQEQIKIAEQIKDSKLKDQAIQSVEAIKASSMQNLRTKFMEDFLDQLQKEKEARDALTKAEEKQQIVQGKAAEMAGTTGGTLRGAGQRPTSFEVGAARQTQQAQLQAKRDEAQRILMAEAQRIGKTTTDVSGRKVISDLNAVKNSLLQTQKTGAILQEKQKYDTTATSDAVQKAQTAFDKQTESVNKAASGLDEMEQILGPLNQAQQDLSKTVEEGTKNMETFNKAVKSSPVAQGGAAPSGAKSESVAGILNNILNALNSNFNELKSFAHTS